MDMQHRRGLEALAALAAIVFLVACVTVILYPRPQTLDTDGQDHGPIVAIEVTHAGDSLTILRVIYQDGYTVTQNIWFGTVRYTIKETQ